MTPQPTSVKGPRINPSAVWERYVGVDAAPADQVAVAIALCGGALLGSLTAEAEFAGRVVLGLLGADVCGGLVAHLLGPVASQVRSNGRGIAGHGLWVCGHLMQYIIFAWAVGEMEPARMTAIAVALSLGAAMVLHAKPMHQRRVGLAVTCASLFFVDAIGGLEGTASWFLPLLLAKVFVAYLPAPPPDDETPLTD